MAKLVWRRALAVERRDAHQPVDARLGLEPAIGVLAQDLDRGRLDARPPRPRSPRSTRPCSRAARPSAGTCAAASRPSPGSRCRRRRRRPAGRRRCASASPDSMISSCSRSTCSFSRSGRARTSSSVASSPSSSASSASPTASASPCSSAALALDRGGEAVALAHERLRLLGVVPELGVLRERVQLVQPRQGLSQSKMPPLQLEAVLDRAGEIGDFGAHGESFGARWVSRSGRGSVDAAGRAPARRWRLRARSATASAPAVSRPARPARPIALAGLGARDEGLGDHGLRRRARAAGRSRRRSARGSSPGGVRNGVAGLSLERRLHDLDPDRQRQGRAGLAGCPSAAAGRSRRRRRHDEIGREADEPGVLAVVRGAGLAGQRLAERLRGRGRCRARPRPSSIETIW